MKASYKVFTLRHTSRENTYSMVAKFLNDLNPDQVISIAHTREDVVVWYWDGAPAIVADVRPPSRIRCGILAIPTFLPPTQPPPGTLMCGVK